MVKGRMGADGEDKKLTRLIKNREAAQQARDKKKQYVSDLETENETLKKKVSELETKCSSLEKHCTTINEELSKAKVEVLRMENELLKQELSKERAKVKVDKDIEQSGTPQDIGLQEDERPQKKRKPTDSCIEALDN